MRQRLPIAIGALALLASIACGDEPTRQIVGLRSCGSPARPIAALVGYPKANDKEQHENEETDLWVLLPSGETRRVTSDGRSTWPAVAPDASGMLYKRLPPRVEGQLPTGSVELVWYDFDTDEHSVVLDNAPFGNGPVALARDGVTYAAVGGFGSPNGRIAIASRRSSEPPAPVTAQPATPPNFGESQPAWAPDGRSLAYVATLFSAPNNVSTDTVWLADLAAGVRRPLYTLPALSAGLGLSWAQDGSAVMLWSSQVRGSKVDRLLTEIPLDGTPAEQLPAVPDVYAAPQYGDSAKSSVVALVRQGTASLQRWQRGRTTPESIAPLDVPYARHLAIADCALVG